MPKLLGMNNVYARTVSIETGMQNFPLCIGVITLSFPPQLLYKIVLVPMVTGLGVLSNCSVFVIIYRVIRKFKENRERKAKKALVMSKDDAEKAVELELLSNGNVE